MESPFAQNLLNTDNLNSNELLLAVKSGRGTQYLRKRLRPTYRQRTILIMLGMFSLLAIILYQWRVTRLIIYPFAILSTVFHEAGHALACLLTGGRMREICVAMDESGVTRFQGGWFCFILPAGYVGSTLAGALLVFSSFGRKTSRWVAGGVATLLLFTLYWAGDIYTVVASISICFALIAACTYQGGLFCRHVIALLGAVCSLQACLAILSSTVLHTIEGSDAYVFARKCSVLLPAFVYGIIWLLVSVLLLFTSVLMAIVCFK